MDITKLKPIVFSLNIVGFSYRITNPLHFVHEILTSNKTNVSPSMDADSDILDEAVTVTEASHGISSDTIVQSMTDTLTSELKTKWITVSAALDSTQQEALSVLKKLMIIENDVKGDELCTRTEYARGLVHVNKYLERRSKHRIVPSILMAGSVVAAFDYVAIEDQDFVSIQALAESGIIFSKLSKISDGSAPDVSVGEEGLNFFPERFVSRQDLIIWKAQLEYEFMSNVGEEIRRFKPTSPSTKAQAAVARTSGKMTEAIHVELLRLEAENSARLAVMEEIRLRGLMKQHSDFEQEKLAQEKYLSEYLKRKGAVDCQRQLHLSLKEEVNEMLERLASERIQLTAQQQSLQDL
ncbi:hypothetical protein RJ641_003236 [Dillenia turbinata]|uniref:Uncharacterized protein n=1 Tax=Dillenia turbinata TaxID=194707 RepID=A0AAN8ZF21_9MAGN